MFQSNQKDESCSVDVQDSPWLECKLPEGDGHRLIWVAVVPPRKLPESRFRMPSGEIKSSQCLRKKSSAFKEPVKEVVEAKKPSLLGVLLAAMNRVVGDPTKEQDRESDSASQGEEDRNDHPSEKQEDLSNLDAPKKLEGKQRSKLAERNEEFKRYVKMEAKFNTLSARFQDVKNKMSLSV